MAENEEVVVVKVEKEITVKPIRVEGDMVLVEYEQDGVLQRASVKKSDVSKEGEITPTKLKKGIAYGMKWEELEIPKLTGEDVANELRKHGLWTGEDVLRNASALQNTIGQLYAPLLVEIIKFSKTGGKK